MNDYDDGIPSIPCDRLSWDRLIKFGRDRLNVLDLSPAIQAFAAAGVAAAKAGDDPCKEQSRHWLAGALREFARVNRDQQAMKQAMGLMHSVVGMRDTDLIELMLDVCAVYETQSNFTLAEAIYRQLLIRAQRCPMQAADDYCSRIQRSLFQNRQQQSANAPSSSITLSS